MAVKSQYEVRKNYVYIRCTGSYTLESMLKVYEQAYKVAGEAGFRAAILDIRELGEPGPTVMERYEQGIYLAEHNHLRIWLALVGYEPHVDPGRFGETVAKNRGGLGKVFSDLDEAITWIQEEVINIPDE